MRAIVCGGRDYRDRSRVYVVLDANAPTALATGGQRGADTLAFDWAMSRGVPVTTFVPDWDQYGRAAGPIRNQYMLERFEPDIVIAFPGGRGTADMVRRAKAAGVRVVEVA